MDRTGITLAENLRRRAGGPLLFQLGTRFCYSLALDMIDALIEAATGFALPQAVQILSAEPLRLNDTGFSIPDTIRLATAYAD